MSSPPSPSSFTTQSDILTGPSWWSSRLADTFSFVLTFWASVHKMNVKACEAIRRFITKTSPIDSPSLSSWTWYEPWMIPGQWPNWVIVPQRSSSHGSHLQNSYPWSRLSFHRCGHKCGMNLWLQNPSKEDKWFKLSTLSRWLLRYENLLSLLLCYTRRENIMKSLSVSGSPLSFTDSQWRLWTENKGKHVSLVCIHYAPRYARKIWYASAPNPYIIYWWKWGSVPRGRDLHIDYFFSIKESYVSWLIFRWRCH